MYDEFIALVPRPVFEFIMINKLVLRATETEIIYHERIHHKRGFSRDYRAILLSYWPKLPCRHTRTVSTSLREMWGGGEGVMERLGICPVPALGPACTRLQQ